MKLKCPECESQSIKNEGDSVMSCKDCDLISNQEPFEMNERFYTLVRIDSTQINLERTGNLSKDMTYFTWKKIK